MDRSELKVVAPENIAPMLALLDMSHLERSWVRVRVSVRVRG